MISIIIPLYNKELFIERTLNSVLNQTYKDFEIILINDGSTDQSAAIVKKHKDVRIKYIEQTNHGVSATRNHGIKLSSGEFISFLDADDIWHPQFLERLYTLSLDYPDYSFFCCAQKNRIIPNLPMGISIIEDHCKYDYIYCTGCSIIRRSIFEEIGGFREGVQLGEDRDMWLKIGCKYHTVYINEELIFHPETTEGNLSRIIDVSRSFPYWEWFSYPYPIKKSLYKYTNKMLISNAKILVNQKRYKDAWFFLKKCKRLYAIKTRIELLYRIIFRD